MQVMAVRICRGVPHKGDAMFVAKDILPALMKVDGGCAYCIGNFLENVPNELEKELRELLKKTEEYRDTTFELY